MTQSLMVCAEDAMATPGHTEQFGDCCLPILTSFLGEGKVRLRSSNWNDLREDSIFALPRKTYASEK